MARPAVRVGRFRVKAEANRRPYPCRAFFRPEKNHLGTSFLRLPDRKVGRELLSWRNGGIPGVPGVFSRGHASSPAKSVVERRHGSITYRKRRFGGADFPGSKETHGDSHFGLRG